MALQLSVIRLDQFSDIHAFSMIITFALGNISSIKSKPMPNADAFTPTPSTFSLTPNIKGKKRQIKSATKKKKKKWIKPTSNMTLQTWKMHWVIASDVPDIVTARSVEFGSISEATCIEAPVTCGKGKWKGGGRKRRRGKRRRRKDTKLFLFLQVFHPVSVLLIRWFRY